MTNRIPRAQPGLGKLLALLVLAGPLPAGDSSPVWSPPQWSVGDGWTISVRTEVRRAEPGEDGEVHYTRSSSRPRVWDYAVAQRQEIEGFPAARLKLVATPREAGDAPVELDFIARLHQQRVAVLAMEGLRYFAPGGKVERSFREEFHEPAPVLFQGAPVPTSFPMILLGQVGERTFSKTRMVGTLPFADDVVQEILAGDRARKRALDLGLRIGDRPVWNVRVLRPLDRETMEQIWVEGDPWPAWTRSGPLEASLVY